MHYSISHEAQEFIKNNFDLKTLWKIYNKLSQVTDKYDFSSIKRNDPQVVKAMNEINGEFFMKHEMHAGHAHDTLRELSTQIKYDKGQSRARDGAYSVYHFLASNIDFFDLEHKFKEKMANFLTRKIKREEERHEERMEHTRRMRDLLRLEKKFKGNKETIQKPRTHKLPRYKLFPTNNSKFFYFTNMLTSIFVA